MAAGNGWIDKKREREREWCSLGSEMGWEENERGNEVIQKRKGAESEGEEDYGREKDGCCDKDGGWVGILMSKNDRQETAWREKNCTGERWKAG